MPLSHTPTAQVGTAATAATAPRHWLRAGWLMTASGWSANQYSSLLGAYRAHLGLTTVTTTALFAVYVVGLIPGLLVGGPLADRHGRRRVTFTALGISALATCLLMAGPAAPVLLWPGRFLTGVGAGTLLTAGSVWIKELSTPPYGTAPTPGAAARRSGLFLSAGFATGGLAASLIAQWAPYPMTLAYVPHLVLVTAAALSAARAPETVPPRTPDTAAPEPAVPAHRIPFRRLVVPVAPWVFASPAIAFAVLPGLVDTGLHGWQTVYAGIITAVTPGAGLLVAPLARRLSARHRIGTAAAGLLVTAAGLLTGALAVARAEPAVALFAAALLGAGYGLCVAYGLTEVAALAPPHHLARLTARFWTLCYLGFFAPYVVTLLTGAFTPHAIFLGAAVLALVTLAVVVRAGARTSD
ncbi:major facilitator family transporter [Streptomyces albospinus]|uniref:Major facilitator family transporter n=1 Tax=Streptomyces albospinus TaxID=285515 RepID=A0ABQ2UYM4_9ACTN|nr:MFS transporter [Streptomyces albospinus]GGU60458.1 major facilitator family transporter [Streptomyces albospinus]